MSTSVMHQHLATVVRTEWDRCGRGPLRLLDVGFGDGRFLEHASAVLAEALPEFYGLEVLGPGVQKAGFFDRTVDRLRETVPAIDWSSQLRAVETGEAWPFPAGSVDVVVSNQVLEHVFDLDSFFAQTHRVLREGGIAVHLFPLRHYVLEGHLLLPFVHRLDDHDVRTGWIEQLSRIGLGKWKRVRGTTAAEFAERHADFLNFFTCYRSRREVMQAAARHGFRASLRYTPQLYAAKLRRLTGASPLETYPANRRLVADPLLCRILSYVSSVCLVLEKRQVYRPPSAIHG